VFVRYYLELDLPFTRAEDGLLRAPEEWLPGMLRDAESRGGRLLADVGFALGEDRRVAKEVEVRIGAPYRSGSKTSVPLTWTATGPQYLFPSMEADLDVAALGPSRTQLSISARYRPPLGPVGRALDRAILHRVAEATVKDFLDQVAVVVDETARAVP
jgi:hypothetical protein